MEAAEEEVIWVVSDLHLGLANSHHERFSEFLRYSAQKPEFEALDSEKNTIKKFNRPKRLILLGDILELTDPAEDDFKNVLEHLLKSLKGFLDISEEIIFIPGNHDYTMESYAHRYSIADPRFRILRRGYKGEDPRRILVGEKHYYFIHGQQFDRLFVLAGPFYKIPGFLQRIHQIFKGLFPLEGWSILFVFILTLLSYYTNIWPEWIPIEIIAILGLLSIPRVFTFMQGKIWESINRYLTNRGRMTEKTKYKSVEYILSEGYFDKEKSKKMKADVLVFGHTHKSGVWHKDKTSGSLKEPPEITLVNTGSWVEEINEKHKDTLVVIDKKGVSLLEWNFKDKTFSIIDSFDSEEL